MKRKYGEKKIFENSGNLNIIHSNIRGLNSKVLSLQSIMKVKDADVVIVNETQLVGKKKVEIPGYKCYQRNRTGIGGGGISTYVRNSLVKDTLELFKGAENDEILITRHSQFHIAVNVINFYGSQENRSTTDQTMDLWANLLAEIAKIEAKGEFVCLIGDFNRHVGDIIPGNKDKQSFGGKLIRDLIDTKKYVLVNATTKAVGGPYTRYDPADPTNDSKKSALDLCVVSSELFDYIEKLVIDKTFTFTPFRPVNGPPVYTDHYALELVFRNLPVKTNKIVATHKNIRWNTNKEGGWEKYSELAGTNEKLLEIANSELMEPEVLMNKIEKEMNNMKHVAFGKVKEKSNKKSFNPVDIIQSEKVEIFENKIGMNDSEFAAKVENIDKRLSSALIGQQRESFLARLENITKVKRQKGRSAAVFNLKDDVIGHKKTGQEATILIDPMTGTEVTSPNEIKRVSLGYCKELLTNRKPKAEYEDDILLKNVIHDKRMIEIIQNDLEYLAYDKFEESYNIIKKKPGDK